MRARGGPQITPRPFACRLLKLYKELTKLHAKLFVSTVIDRGGRSETASETEARSGVLLGAIIGNIYIAQALVASCPTKIMPGPYVRGYFKAVRLYSVRLTVTVYGTLRDGFREV